MIYFVVRRFANVLATVFAVVTLVFFALHAVPGDPVEVMLGDQSSIADRQQLQQTLGLNQPLRQQYQQYLLSLFRGDMGNSIQKQQAVTTLIAQRLPITIGLALVSMLLAVLLAIPLGMWAAKNFNRWQDKFALALSLGGISIPNFVLGPVLVLYFSLLLQWFPSNGNEATNAWVLPAIALGTAMAAMLSRMLRSSLLDIANQPFVLAARARGNTLSRCWDRHIFPNALLPVITVFGLQLGALLGGAVIVEIVFAFPGIGSLLVEAVEQRDYPVVQGCILVVTLAYVLTNGMIELLYGIADPRIRNN